MLNFLLNPVTGDQGLNPIVIIAAVVAVLLVVFLLVWPKISKKDEPSDDESNAFGKRRFLRRRFGKLSQ